MFTYSYRNDGPLQTEQINDTQVAHIIHQGKTTLSYTYTNAGRLAGRSESGVAALPSPQTTIHYQTSPATGLVSEQDTPVGNLTGLAYTAESELSQVTSPGSPACTFPTTGYTYTVRGELIQSPQCPLGNPSTPFQANGLAVHVNGTSSGTYTWNALLTAMNQIVGSSSCDGVSDPCVSSWQYDFAGRLTQQQGPLPIIGTNQYNVPAYHSYDAENHLISTQLVRPLPSPAWYENSAWGPDGHPIKIGTYATASSEADERLHWNGDQLLFTTNQTSGLTLDDIKVDVQGDILPGDSGYKDLTFYDRGPGGTILGCHNATGTTYVGLTDSWLGTPTFRCAVPSPTAAPSMPASTIWLGSPYGGTIGLGYGRTIGMPRLDGFVDGFNTVQGVRAFDATAGLWMSPDTGFSSISNPISQKSYAWNNNNPLSFADPSGNDTLAIGYWQAISGTEVYHTFGILFDDDGRVIHTYSFGPGPISIMGFAIGPFLNNQFATDKVLSLRNSTIRFKTCSGMCPWEAKLNALYYAWPKNAVAYGYYNSNTAFEWILQSSGLSTTLPAGAPNTPGWTTCSGGASIWLCNFEASTSLAPAWGYRYGSLDSTLDNILYSTYGGAIPGSITATIVSITFRVSDCKMKRKHLVFSLRDAAICLIGALFLELLAIGVFGAKVCGNLIAGFYTAIYISPYLYPQHGWLLAPLVIAFGLGGIFYGRISRRRDRVILGWGATALIVILLTASYFAKASSPCTPL